MYACLVGRLGACRPAAGSRDVGRRRGGERGRRGNEREGDRRGEERGEGRGRVGRYEVLSFQEKSASSH